MSAHNRIDVARSLLSHPDLIALVESGVVSAWSARLLVVEVSSLDQAAAAEVVADVVGRLRRRHETGRRRWTPAEIRRATKAARLRLHPDTDDAVRHAAWASRKVEVLAGGDGMAYLQAHLDATDAHRIHRRLTALAKGLADPSRTTDQLRADLLTDVLLAAGRSAPQEADGTGADPEAGDRDLLATPGGSAAEEPPATSPTSPASPTSPTSPAPAAPLASLAPRTVPRADSKPEICVVVSLATLLGLAEGGAEIPGFGPIPAETARALAADGAWRAWVADAASGQVVATGSRRYTPSPALARLVRAREPECRMPGCRRAATECDLDHTIAYPAGPTSAANLGPLCRRHHQLKTHGRWVLTTTEQGWRWRLPSGLTQTDQPDPPDVWGVP